MGEIADALKRQREEREADKAREPAPTPDPPAAPPPGRKELMEALADPSPVGRTEAPAPPPATTTAQALAEWRREIDRLYEGQPSFVTARALRAPVAAYDLPKDEFLALIDGMEMDATGPIVAPSREELALYCRRVAGAVGMLSINAFGAKEPAARELAVALGEGLQLTNILRDLDEDGAEGRLYLPREDLEAAGITARDPAGVLADPALAAVCEGIAARAEARFAESLELLERCHRRALKPCVLMMEMYRRTLRRLRARGWAMPRKRVSLPAWEKLWILLRYGIF